MKESLPCSVCGVEIGTMTGPDEGIYTVANNGRQCYALPVSKHFSHCKNCCARGQIVLIEKLLLWVAENQPVTRATLEQFRKDSGLSASTLLMEFDRLNGVGFVKGRPEKKENRISREEDESKSCLFSSIATTAAFKEELRRRPLLAQMEWYIPEIMCLQNQEAIRREIDGHSYGFERKDERIDVYSITDTGSPIYIDERSPLTVTYEGIEKISSEILAPTELKKESIRIDIGTMHFDFHPKKNLISGL